MSYSDYLALLDYLDKLEEDIDLNEVYKSDLDSLANKLVSLGIFSDVNSIKLYLATRPFTDLRYEEETLPITYEKGYDETDVTLESSTFVDSTDHSYETIDHTNNNNN